MRRLAPAERADRRPVGVARERPAPVRLGRRRQPGPSPASRRVNASRAAARSGSGTATANQSRPSRSRSSIPNARHAVPLAISTRPCSSSATISASAPSKLRRARARTRGGRDRRRAGRRRWRTAPRPRRWARAPRPRELDHADALLAERDRERGGGDEAGAHGLAGSSRTQTGRRNAQTRPGRPWPAAKLRSCVAPASSVTAVRAPGLPQRGAAQLRPSGRQTAPKVQPSDSPSVESTRSHSASGSRPATRWSAIACWAPSSRCAPPTRRRMRACSSSRVSTLCRSERSGRSGRRPARRAGPRTGSRAAGAARRR